MKGFSIRQKITMLMVSTSIVLILAILTVSYIVNKKNITELCESYLYDTCISASDTLYESFYGDSERNDLSVRLEYILNNVGIDTMESSRGYLVDTDGTYLYHENSELVALTKALTEELRRSRTIDFDKREDARARMRVIVKKLLKKHKYPPEGMEDAVQVVMAQCMQWADNSFCS